MMELTRVTLTDPKQGGYMYNEAIKTLRSNIQFSGKNLKVITITSCFPNEGKSDISFHLAREIGKSGKRVLLIDAHIRKSVYLTRYNIQERVEGLSSFLSGQISWDRLINRTNYQNLDMIFSGPVAPNPSELLGQREFKVFLDRLKGVYDYILIALEPFFFLYTDDSIQGNPETCKQSSIMLNYEVKNIQIVLCTSLTALQLNGKMDA